MFCILMWLSLLWHATMACSCPLVAAPRLKQAISSLSEWIPELSFSSTPSELISKCPWARHRTPNCSRWVGWCLVSSTMQCMNVMYVQPLPPCPSDGKIPRKTLIWKSPRGHIWKSVAVSPRRQKCPWCPHVGGPSQTGEKKYWILQI